MFISRVNPMHFWVFIKLEFISFIIWPGNSIFVYFNRIVFKFINVIKKTFRDKTTGICNIVFFERFSIKWFRVTTLFVCSDWVAIFVGIGGGNIGTGKLVCGFRFDVSTVVLIEIVERVEKKDWLLEFFRKLEWYFAAFLAFLTLFFVIFDDFFLDFWVYYCYSHSETNEEDRDE